MPTDTHITPAEWTARHQARLDAIAERASREEPAADVATAQKARRSMFQDLPWASIAAEWRDTPVTFDVLAARYGVSWQWLQIKVADVLPKGERLKVRARKIAEARNANRRKA